MELPADVAADRGSSSPYDIPLGVLLARGQARALSAPFAAWDIGFEIETLPPAAGRSKRLAGIVASCAGRVDAVAFWWTCDLDDEGRHVLDSAPAMGGAVGAGEDGAGHQDHWLQAFTYVGSAEVKVAAGESVAVRTHHNDETIWFDLDGERSAGDAEASSSERYSEGAPAPPLPEGGGSGLYDVCSAERIAQMNQRHRNEVMRRQVRSWLKREATRRGEQKGGGGETGTDGLRVLTIGDGPLLPLAVAAGLEAAGAQAEAEAAAACTDEHAAAAGRTAAMLRNARVLALEGEDECTALSVRFLACNGALDRVSATTAEPGWAVAPASVHLVCAEPHFQPPRFSATWGAASLMRYWSSCLALRPYLAAGAQLLPSRAVLHVAALSCEALWRARRPLEGAVEGVDVSALNCEHKRGFKPADQPALATARAPRVHVLPALAAPRARCSPPSLLPALAACICSD